MKNTVVTFRAAKGQDKLVVLTAYDYSTARVMDDAGVNALLVGDSLGMVMLGHEDTLSVSMDDMIRHCAAVARAAATSASSPATRSPSCPRHRRKLRSQPWPSTGPP